MSRSNDELYDYLLEQLIDLTSRHYVGQSRQRNAKLRETVYLLNAYKRGEDITLAKLAYCPDVEDTHRLVESVKRFLGCETKFYCRMRDLPNTRAKSIWT
jgi:hypothetical protein